MSESTELAALYSAIEDSSRLLDVDCSRERVWPVLTAYEAGLSQAVIAFRVATGAQHAGEFDYRFMTGVDPYAVALANGFIATTEHPVGTLLAQLAARFPIADYGADFGVVGGFKKTYAFFPPDGMQPLADLAGVPSMPAGVAAHTDVFARYGLHDRTSLIGIDYPHRTVNLYFGEPPAESFEPGTIRSMVRDLGLPEPSEQLLGLGRKAFGIYVTLGWDSPRIERICYAVMTPDPLALADEVDPKIELFVRSRRSDAADSRFVYAVTLTEGGEYYKLQAYYQWHSEMLDVMLLSDAALNA
jgi:hypothetical protein